MANVSFLLAAEWEYQEALAWYHARSPQAAAGFEGAIEAAIQRIASTPELFPLCDERHRFYALRRYDYCVIYRILSESEVQVVAVAHGKRSATSWQGRN